jgi:hypothetical protein
MLGRNVVGWGSYDHGRQRLCWPRRVVLICELAAREGHAGGKEGGSISQASFGRFIASASRSVPVLEKQRPPRPALRAGDAAKGAMLSFFMAGAPNLFASFRVLVTGLPACSRGCT